MANKKEILPESSISYDSRELSFYRKLRIRTYRPGRGILIIPPQCSGNGMFRKFIICSYSTGYDAKVNMLCRIL